MPTTIIVDAGDFPKKEYPLYLISQADHIVCTEGAFATWLRQAPKIFGHQRLPDAVVGDMDTVSAKLRKEYPSIMVHVEEQDDNDQTKALTYALEHFPDTDRVHIIGGTGKREDHTIGNMGLLMEYTRMFDLRGISIDMVSDHSTIFAITDSTELHVGEGRSISIFSPDNSLKISSRGLLWPTDSVVFDNWWPATLNRASEDIVTLTLSHKSLALIVLN